MNDYKYHYLFTTFDMETLDLEDFKYNFVNMTAFRIVDIDDLHVKELLRGISKFQTNKNVQPINSSFIEAEAAFMYDSVFVFAVGLQTLDQSHTLKIPNVSCDQEHSWDGGLSLINYINAVSHFPFFIRIKFSERKDSISKFFNILFIFPKCPSLLLEID
ncbi:unnamed protein product [Acanthoscelides obtectus]|nr:unnamed protein product [Acanthoscelides obtectus]CAK1673663.1 Glutamate receptor ionotropic, kainate 1 [Acanthoscelides obtectus]